MSARLFALPVVVGMLFGLHYYLWTRLVRDPQLPSGWARAATIALILLALNMPIALIIGRFVSRRVGGWLAWPAYVWMGMFGFLLLSVVATDLVRLVARGAGAIDDPARRLALHRFLGATSALVAAGLAAWSTRVALGRVQLHEISVALAKLPAKLDGFRIAQLTDIHIGPTIGRAFLQDLVDRTNALDADVVAITGDLVDGSVDSLREEVAPLAQLRARHGVFFVTGNHEYYSGADAWIAELERLGLRVLQNEHVTLGEGDAQIDLAGVYDYSAASVHPSHAPDVGRAVAGRDVRRPLILLAHQPKAVFAAARHEVDLQLSGHTHGGQMWPWMYMVRLQQPFIIGLTRVGPTQLYVSPGTGYWGPPMRLGTHAEITHITLRRAADG